MRKFLRVVTKRFWLTFIMSAITLGFTFIAGVYLYSFLLGPPKLTSEQNTIYYSHSDKIIGEERGAESRYWVKLEDMSPSIINATLAIEDQHFYDHSGFDFKRIAGAVWADLKSLSLKEGASTLTQQYARNLFLSHEKTLLRKLKEAFYTVRLEMFYSKDEILEGYLNTIYYGHGAYGVEAASRYFYDKSANELSLAEASMLAAIPKGPTYYSPFNNLKKAKSRQQQILTIMEENNRISKHDYFLAARESLNFAEAKKQKRVSIAPYLQDSALQEAAGILDMPRDQVQSGGYQIYTTLDIRMQKKLEHQAEMVISSKSEIEIGAMAMDPGTGGIRALLGGRDYQKTQYNRAVQARRMPGSTFKPFLYYTALKNGYTPTTMLMSKPTAFELQNGEVYQPSNFNGYYANKPISLAQALALSDNVYAVKTNLFLGPEKLVNTAKTLGIDSKLPKVPSLALGSATVSVENMVTGYAMLANGGYELEGHTIREIVDKNGKTVFKRADAKGDRVLDAKAAFILTQLMTGMFDHNLDGYMQVTGSTISNQLNRTYAGKSGTTNTDSWMIGYSPTLVTGIWTGFDNNKQMTNPTEVGYAKDIWAGFMRNAHKGKELQAFAAPEGVVAVPIDPVSGKRSTPYCDKNVVMYFEKGTEPLDYCTAHLPGDKKKEEPEQKEKDKGIFRKLFDFFLGR